MAGQVDDGADVLVLVRAPLQLVVEAQPDDPHLALLPEPVELGLVARDLGELDRHLADGAHAARLPALEEGEREAVAPDERVQLELGVGLALVGDVVVMLLRRGKEGGSIATSLAAAVATHPAASNPIRRT